MEKQKNGFRFWSDIHLIRIQPLKTNRIWIYDFFLDRILILNPNNSVMKIVHLFYDDSQQDFFF